MSQKFIEIWTIYEKPRDFPDSFVVRLFKNATPTIVFYIADTLERARDYIPPDKQMLDRHPSDPASIVETWV
jgi:hypothetical protein